MTRSVKHILREALELGEADREELAGLLIKSLEVAREEGVEEAWAAECDRRAKQIDSGEIATIPWEEVRDRIFGNGRDTSEDKRLP